MLGCLLVLAGGLLLSPFVQSAHLSPGWWLQKALQRMHLNSYECTNNYSIEILSVDPVMFYINGFLTDFEIDYLINT